MKIFLKVFGIPLLVIAIVAITFVNGFDVSAASVWYVSLGGSDGHDCLSPATACATVGGALAKAASGDTIQVTAETYMGTGSQVVLVNKDILLSGGWNGAFTSRTGFTTLDGEDTRVAMDVTAMSR
jgi:hypothetical protein